MCGSMSNCQTLCLGARPRYNLVVDEDVKKPTKQTKKWSLLLLLSKGGQLLVSTSMSLDLGEALNFNLDKELIEDKRQLHK